RRQHPLLDVSCQKIDEASHALRVGSRNYRLDVTRTSFIFDVENLSLVTAEEVEVGMVSWSLSGADTEINRYLRSHIDIIEAPSSPYQYKMHLIHRYSPTGGSGKLNIDPFKRSSLQPIGPYDFPFGAPSRISCAVYVICKGSPPTWFQLQYLCTGGTGHPG